MNHPFNPYVRPHDADDGYLAELEAWWRNEMYARYPETDPAREAPAWGGYSCATEGWRYRGHAIRRGHGHGEKPSADAGWYCRQCGFWNENHAWHTHCWVCRAGKDYYKGRK